MSGDGADRPIPWPPPANLRPHPQPVAARGGRIDWDGAAPMGRPDPAKPAPEKPQQPGGTLPAATQQDPNAPAGFGSTADNGATATDNSAAVNTDGSNGVAGNADAEANEIAAVPDPDSPAGQAAIRDIIEKYQGQSAGTVASNAADQQDNGAKAATDDSGSGSGGADAMGGLLDALSGLGSSLGGGGLGGLGGGLGGGGLMDLLSSLLGGGLFGSALGNGMDPLGQGTLASQAAADPFADPFASPGSATPASTAAVAGPDPFAAAPGTDPAVSPAAEPAGSDGTGSDKPEAAGQPAEEAAATSEHSDIDMSEFSNSSGVAVPSDPAMAD